MRTITHENLAAGEPLTPLNADEAVRYVRCNLTNRLVHPDSTVDGCNEVQIVFEVDGDDTIPHKVGVGVRGEVTAAMVQVVTDQIGGGE